MLNVGLIGVGGVSGAHIPGWNSIAETNLVALCDIRPEQMGKYSEQRCYYDFDEMLENEQLDILDICLPTYLHADYAIKAMEHGINVICEKPISLKADDVKRIYAAAKENNVKFMVAQVLRFWPEYERAKQLYDSKKYGKLLSGSMTRLGSYPVWSWDNWMMDIKRSGLVPFDLHIHDLDFLIYAFGKPEKISNFRAKRKDQDYINVVYKYDDFFITTEASWYASPYPFAMKFRLQFEDAIYAYEGGKATIYERGGNVIDLSAEVKSNTKAINLPTSDAYTNEIRYFTDCVLNQKQVDKVQPDQLKTVIDILNAL